MELSYKEWGPDRADSAQGQLVFLHGMGGTGQLWRPIAARLENQYQILAPDQRGHGGSLIPNTGDQYRPEDYAQDVLDTLDAVGWDKVFLIGHSMGARTTAALLHLAPERIRGAVLVDLGFDGLAGGGLGPKLEIFLGDLPPSFPTRAEAKEFLMQKTPDETIALYLIAVAQPKEGGGIFFPFDQDALLKTLELARGVSVRPWVEEAGARNQSVLALRGAVSKVWSKEDFEKEKAHFASMPSITLEEVAGAGHGLPFEKRDAFVTRLLEFVGEAG